MRELLWHIQAYKMKWNFSQFFYWEFFYATVCHSKVTANFLPGRDAGTSVTHPGLQNEMKFQPNLSLRIFLCHCMSLESNGRLSSWKWCGNFFDTSRRSSVSHEGLQNMKFQPNLLFRIFLRHCMSLESNDKLCCRKWCGNFCDTSRLTKWNEISAKSLIENFSMPLYVSWK